MAKIINYGVTLIRNHSWARFAIIGGIATVIHYGVYYLMLELSVNYNIGYTIGYVVSLVFNLIATARYTFKTKLTLKKSLGFFGAHVVNYFLHIALLNLYIYLGLGERIAPVFVYIVAIPVNFFLVRAAMLSIQSHSIVRR